jgi:hypothetical protein
VAASRSADGPAHEAADPPETGKTNRNAVAPIATAWTTLGVPEDAFGGLLPERKQTLRPRAASLARAVVGDSSETSLLGGNVEVTRAAPATPRSEGWQLQRAVQSPRSSRPVVSRVHSRLRLTAQMPWGCLQDPVQPTAICLLSGDQVKVLKPPPPPFVMSFVFLPLPRWCVQICARDRPLGTRTRCVCRRARRRPVRRWSRAGGGLQVVEQHRWRR